MTRPTIFSSLWLSFLLAAGCTNDQTTDSDCAGSKCDGLSESDAGGDAGRPTSLVYINLDTRCGQISYDSFSNELGFITDDGEITKAVLEWSHPNATIDYLTDAGFREALEQGADCELGYGLSIYANFSGEVVDAYFASCGGAIGNVVTHMETLANEYFDGVCSAAEGP